MSWCTLMTWSSLQKLKMIYRESSIWDGMEAKGLRVNNDKTKILISGPDLNTLKDTGNKHPCGVCSGVVPSSVLVALIGYTRNAVVLKVNLKSTLNFDVTDVMVMPVLSIVDLVRSGILMSSKHLK